MLLNKLLAEASRQLKRVSSSPELDALVLLSWVKKIPTAKLLALGQTDMDQPSCQQFNILLARRLQGEPIAYITGIKEFMGHQFRVNEHTLIPRPQTETMVEAMLAAAKKLTPPAVIVDIGTGSGAIIISLALALGKKHLYYGLDISPAALAVAKANARRHDLAINWQVSYLVKQQLWQPDHRSPLLLAANLPYLRDDYLNHLESVDQIGLKFEPRLALAGGPDGLDYYRQLAKQLDILAAQQSGQPLRLFLEIMPDQAETIRQIYRDKTITILKDLSQQDRLVIIDY